MKKSLRKLVEKYFASFWFFYKVVGPRVLITVVLSTIVGLLDGFGLAMFLPLLQLVGGEGDVNASGLGSLHFIADAIVEIGFALNLNSVLLFLCIFFSLKGITRFFAGKYDVYVRQLFIKKIRLTLINNLSRVSYKYFVLTDSGRIQSTMTGEADRLLRAHLTYTKALDQGIMVIVYVILAFFVDAKFAMLITAGGLMTNFIFKYIYKLTKKASVQLTKNMHNFQGEVIQQVANFKYLKATGLMNRYVDRMQVSVINIEEKNRKIGIYNVILDAIREPLLIIVVSLVILIQSNVLGAPLGPVILSLLFFFRALMSLMLMQISWNGFLGLSGSIENVNALNEEMRKAREVVGKKKFSELTGSLLLSNVGFKYGDIKILNNINLEIKKNESIAFVGESGSGKTTLVGIIAGLFKPDEGNYFIDGLDVRELNIQNFQSKIGYISQDPVIFNDTVYNNVTFWAERTDENMRKCDSVLKKASIFNFIEELENKKDTLLGYNGINLSGGQRQRISIARELFKNINILILDEATSALDSETERDVQASITALQGEFTIIVIAHRLSTIKNVDRIVFLDNGRILNINTFDKLIEEQPKFKRMVELQDV